MTTLPRLYAALLVSALAAAPSAQQTREVRGVVVDENDQPLADVAVCTFDYANSFTTAALVRKPTTRTSANGTFALSYDPWQINTVLFVAKGHVHVAASLGQVDTTPVVLPKARTLAGTVRDTKGKPIPGVRVEARDWFVKSGLFGAADGEWSSWPEPRTAVLTDSSGRFVLTGTCDSAIYLRVGGDKFTVSAYGPLAAGQSFDAVVEPAAVEVAVAKDEGPAKSTAPAAAPPTGVLVQGRLLDPNTNKPVANGSVRVVPPAEARDPNMFIYYGMARRRHAARTDAQGRYSLHVEPGKYMLVAADSNTGLNYRRPGQERNPTPVAIEVVRDRPITNMDLHLQKLVQVTGKIDSLPLPRGAMVRFASQLRNSGDDLNFSLRALVAPDGRFVVEGLQEREYRLQVLLPRGFRQGRPDKLPIKVVDISADTELRIRTAIPRHATVEGTIESNVPMWRLAVTSLPANDTAKMQCAHLNYLGPVCPVRRDGSFALREPPGQRALLVVDLFSGVMLHRTALRTVASGDKQRQDLNVQALPLDVTWQGIDNASSAQIDIVVAKENWPAGLSEMVELGDGRDQCGLHVTLHGKSNPVRLWLREGATRLVLRNKGKVVAKDVVDPAQQQTTTLRAVK